MLNRHLALRIQHEGRVFDLILQKMEMVQKTASVEHH